MQNPLVSIIIPIYNGSNYMRDAIDSALKQTYEHLEIIIVNDGSTDNGATREIALSYGERVRYFEKDNGGVSTALNLGIREMHGEYFSWLSHDDVYYPDKIQIEMNELQKLGEMRRVVLSDDDLLMPRGNLVHHSLRRVFNVYGKRIFETGALAPAFSLISGCTLLIPRQYFNEYGLFDESLRGVQDYKKWFEMFRGKRMVYIDKPLVQSRVHSRQVTNTYGKMKAEEDWLYAWITESMVEEDLEGSGVGLYHFCGAMISKFRNGGIQPANIIAAKRILQMAEPEEADQWREDFKKQILCTGSELYLFCAGRRMNYTLLSLTLRGLKITGVSDSDPAKWGKVIEGLPCVSPDKIPLNAAIIVTKVFPEDVENMLRGLGYKNVIAFDDLRGEILRTPVKKSLVDEFLENYG